VSNGAKVALAVGAGYFLGRTRKMRIAMMLAAAGITGKFPAMPASLVTQGLKSLGASDQLHDLTEQLRGEVLTAAKAATLAAATNRVDALNDRLQGVAPTEEVGRVAGSATEHVGRTAGSATHGLTSVTGRARRAHDDDFEEDEDAYGDEEPLDVEEEDLEDEGFEDEDVDDEDVDDQDLEDEDFEDQDLEDDLEDEDEDENDEPPLPQRRATRRASAPRASTRRSRITGADRDGEPPKGPARRGRASAATKRAPVRRGR
jgi:hypothetical protein